MIRSAIAGANDEGVLRTLLVSALVAFAALSGSSPKTDAYVTK